jgi:acyl-CoA thioester hydrolase
MNGSPSPHGRHPRRRVGITPHWADFDIYGHLNHAAYYALGDTVINEWMRVAAGLDSRTSPVIGVVAASQCDFLREIVYPGAASVEVTVHRLGNTSITFGVTFWTTDGVADGDVIAAQGRWRHVYIDRQSRRSTEIPTAIRDALEPQGESGSTRSTSRGAPCDQTSSGTLR